MPRVPKKVVPTFSQKEVELLLSQLNKKSDSGFRDYVLLLTFVDTSARLSEIGLLEVDDIDFEQGCFLVMGKGGIERYIPFGYRVAKALLRYKLKHRPIAMETNRFWLTAQGTPLDTHRIGRMVSRYGKKCGFKRCYPHKLRHTSSVLYLRNGGDSFSLQKKLGHSSLQMTRHYANLADSDVKAQHMRYGVADRLNVK